MTTNEVPQCCDYGCFNDLQWGGVDVVCAQCQAWYDFWCEVDDSEMDIDWSEFEDITTSEWVEDDE